MKISYKWLQEYFSDPLPEASQLAEALTFHAFEIESVEKKESDDIIDVKVTPNRGHDALSHRGIAKELAAIFSRSLSNDPFAQKPDLKTRSSLLEVMVDDAKLCPRYSAAVLRGIKVKESPRWLKEKLEAVGQRPINNVVDATNFVMFNLGQPLHAFDAKKLKAEKGKQKIIVRTAKEGETIKTLDGKERTLKENNLLIVDAVDDAPIGIAGVMGGESSEIGKETKDIIIESANFNGVSIRKSAKALGLRTDASSRFEHEISPELTAYALRDCVALICGIAGGEAEGYVDVYSDPQKERTVSVSRAHINSHLGLTLAVEDIEAIFKRLGFRYSRADDSFAVIPPFQRIDIEIPEDLIEEVGRIYGYGHVEPVVPPTQKPQEINKRFYYMDRVREALVTAGFSEVYTSSFVPKGKGEVEVLNPAAQDRPMLRKDLTSTMVPALLMNARNAPLLGLSQVRIFEIGTVFAKKEESMHLALCIDAGKATEKEFEVAEKIMAEALGVSVSAKTKDGVREYDFSALLPKCADPVSYEPREPTRKVSYKLFSSYPFVLRDIALWVPEGTAAADVEKLIRDSTGGMLVHLDLFDTFTKEGKTSYAFHLVFQSKDKTMTDAEVNGLMEKVSAALQARDYIIR